MNTIARDIIAVVIILGAIASMFWSVNEAGAELLRVLAGIVAGWYFGKREVPLAGVLNRKK